MTSSTATQSVCCSQCGKELIVSNPHLGDILCSDCITLKTVTFDWMPAPRIFPRASSPDWASVVDRLDRIEQKIDQLLSGSEEPQ